MNNETVRNSLTTFVQDELIPEAGFAPDGGFRVVRFTVAQSAGIFFEDKNRNGMMDPGEGLEDILVSFLTFTPGCSVSVSYTNPDTTNSDGSYRLG